MGKNYHKLPVVDLNLFSIECGWGYFNIKIDGVVLDGDFTELPKELFGFNCSKKQVEIGIEKGIKVEVIFKHYMFADATVYREDGISGFIMNKVKYTYN